MASDPADITWDTELMKNQKYATPMDPTQQFDVLQNPNGTALFFSIGSDKVLNVIQETNGSSEGWTKWDISTILAGRFAQPSIVAKLFAVSQNPQSATTVDLAVVVSLNGSDHLFLAYDVPNDPSSWERSPFWVDAGFDANRAPPSPITITDVYIMNLSGTGIICFVDVLRNPANNSQVVDRYYIDLQSKPKWTFHPLPGDISAGSMSCCLGKRANDPVGGIYTLGFVGNKQQLIYTPSATKSNPNPRAVRLPVPSSSNYNAMASMLDASGNTYLFLALPDVGTLVVWTPDGQNDGQEGQIAVWTEYLMSSQVMVGTKTLLAASLRGQTVVWGLNGVGELYSLSCPSGSETNWSAWSNPVPVCFDTLQFAHYLNVNEYTGNNVLFAQTSDGQLTQLVQDIGTSQWTERDILLPPENVNWMMEYYTYTSHIQLVDKNGQGVPNYYPVFMTASSPVPVYVNDVYHVLRPDLPLLARTDVSGVVTLVQQTQSLTGFCFNVVVDTKDANIVKYIDPHDNAAKRLSTLNSTDSLKAASITDSNGYTKPLVPSYVSKDNSRMKAAVDKFQTLLFIKGQLPRDGSRQVEPLPMVAGGPSNISTSGEGLGDHIKLFWGDLYRWVKKYWNIVKRVSAKFADGFWHFVVETGKDVYAAVMDTVSAVVGAVEYVFKEIEIAYHDIVQYLGFIFNWTDIKRTHSVIKNILKKCAEQAMNSVTDIENGIKLEFATIQKKLDQWAKIPSSGGTIGQQQQLQANVPGHNSPQANWALHHATSNVQDAQSDHTQNDPISKDVQCAFQDVFNLLKNEECNVITMMEQLNDLLQNFSSLTATEICQQALGMIASFLVNSAEDFVLTFLDLSKLFVETFVVLLDAPLNIPIITPIWRDITGSQLSFLDLVCFIGAIPATILYKGVTNTAPFPTNDPLGDKLMAAPNYAALADILNSTELSPDQQQGYEKYMAMVGGPTRAVSGKTTAFDVCAVLSNFLAGIAALGYIPLTAAKNYADSRGTQVPKELKYIIAVCYLGYVMPDLIGSLSTSRTWYNGLNWYFTAFSLIKTAVDVSATIGGNPAYSGFASPIMETALNISWLVPGVGAFIDNFSSKADQVAFAANMLFDTSGALTAGASEKIVGPEVAAAMQITQFVLSWGYFGCVLGTGYCVLKGE